MKILLAYTSGARDRSDPYISLLPTGLCYLQAVLREAGHDAVLANFSGWSADAVERELLARSPHLVGISQWTHNRHASLDLARHCRRLLPGATIAMGGAHATFCSREILADGSPLDLVVMGEGEATLLELVARLAEGRDWRDIRGIAWRGAGGEPCMNAAREPLADLDRLPYPARYLDHAVGIDLELQPEFVLTARGCPSACHFCSSPAFWGRKVRFRSPETIVAEILWLRDRYGVIYISLRDDTFTANRERTLAICRLLEERRAGVLWNCQSRATALDAELVRAMKRAGCECIQLGVESGSPRILEQLGKTVTPSQVELAASLIRDAGINLSIYLISDVPGESEDDYRQTTGLLRRIRPDDAYVSPLAYFPGTRLFQEARAAGRVDDGVFAATAGEAVYVNGRPGKGAGRLHRVIGSLPPGDGRRFARQKELLGYCWTTNVLAGEWRRQCGEPAAALREFEEVTRRDPDNPWGWFLLAEVLQELEQAGKARDAYERVLRLVPRHGPSLQALASLGGDGRRKMKKGP